MASKLYTTGKLAEARAAKGYTQQELADLLTIETGKQLSISTLQKWEQGQLNITPEWALELSRFLRVELKELLVRK